MRVDVAGGADFCECGHRGYHHVTTAEGTLCATFAFPPEKPCTCREYRAIPRSGLAVDDPEAYLLARLVRDREVYAVSDGLGRTELGKEYVAVLREATDRAEERERAATTATQYGGFLKKRAWVKARRAFLLAAINEVREYDGILSQQGVDPDDELAVEDFLRVLREDDLG